MIWRLIGSLVGLALFVVSIPLTISPIPVGLIIMFLAIVILVASNPLAAKFLKWARKRFPWLNRFFRRAEKVLPQELAEPLHKTDDEDDDDSDDEQHRERFPSKKAEAYPMMRRTHVPRRLR